MKSIFLKIHCILWILTSKDFFIYTKETDSFVWWGGKYSLNNMNEIIDILSEQAEVRAAENANILEAESIINNWS